MCIPVSYTNGHQKYNQCRHGSPSGYGPFGWRIWHARGPRVNSPMSSMAAVRILSLGSMTLGKVSYIGSYRFLCDICNVIGFWCNQNQCTML